MLKLFVHKSEVDIKFYKFPAGETGIKLDNPGIRRYDTGPININITCKFEDNNDIINLLLLTDAVKRQYSYEQLHIALTIPYFPYARQDRVCNKGESLSVKVIADLINSQNFATVYITDPHSDVTPAIINNCTVIKQTSAARALCSIRKPENTILVSPDAGANKKVFEFAKEHGYSEVIRADKTRDVATGKITGTKVYWEKEQVDVITLGTTYTHRYGATDKDFLILDDILDGGGTFNPLAEQLQKLTTGKVYLYVSHGIFSKGINGLERNIETIYVSNLMNKELINNLLIKEI